MRELLGGAIFAFAGLILAAPARAAESVDLAIPLPPDQLTAYSVIELQGPAGQEKPVPQLDRAFFFFGRELERGRTLTIPVRTLESIPYAVVFRFPDKPQAEGVRWQSELAFEGVPDVHPFTLAVQAQIDGREALDERSVWKIAGKGGIPRESAKPRNTKTARFVREAALEWTAWFDPEKHAVVRFRFFFTIVTAPVRGDGAETTVTRNEQCDWREQLVAGTPALRDRIGTAIQRGVDALKKAQQPDGSWKGIDAIWHEGNTALMLLALIRSGVYGHDPIVVKGFEWLKKQPFRRVYSVATLVLAIEARYTPLEEIRAAEDYLDNPSAFQCRERRVPPEDKEWMEKAVVWLLGMAYNRRSWSYDEPKGRYDNSCTQYAVLAFDAAQRCGVKLDPKVWRAVAEHFLLVQNRRGADVLRKPHKSAEESGTQTAGIPAKARGWGYQDAASDATGGATYSSMTCAGLTALMLARASLGKELERPFAARIDLAVNDGMAWLETHFDPRFNSPRWDDWYFYSMYGIERVGVLAGSKYLGDRDWYSEGAMVICNLQLANGGWGRWEYDTAFALLFLKKGTVPTMTK